MEFDSVAGVLSSVKNSTIATGVNIVSNPAGLLAFLQANGYLIMIVLMIIEGPIVTYVAAFAASLGIFNIYYVFIISFLGNMASDLIVFYIGRIGKWYVIDKYVSHWLKQKRIKKIKKYLHENPGKTIAAVKLTPPLPVPGIMLIGASELPLKTFVKYSAIITLFYSLSMTILGFYSGIYFSAMLKYVKDITYLIGGFVLLVIIIYVLLRDASRAVGKRIEKI
ncbi:MAG: VTT domain-containing protein [Candidatus Pacearchaeota archaeon]